MLPMTANLLFASYKFQGFELSSSQVYDGADEMASMLVQASGSVSPGSFESSGDSLFIKMTSNSIVNGIGFKASFSSGMCSLKFSQ